MSKDKELLFLPRQMDEDVVLHRSDWGDEEIKRVLRDMNLKVTPQRMIILKTLRDGRIHITAQELFEKVNKVHPDIGFTTVYRMLRNLTDFGAVNEVRMGGLPARYELSPQKHHDHLTCVHCGKICEFENKTIEELQLKIAKQFGFRLTHHILELYGVCHGCQSKGSKE